MKGTSLEVGDVWRFKNRQRRENWHRHPSSSIVTRHGHNLRTSRMTGTSRLRHWNVISFNKILIKKICLVKVRQSHTCQFSITATLTIWHFWNCLRQSSSSIVTFPLIPRHRHVKRHRWRYVVTFRQTWRYVTDWRSFHCPLFNLNIV